MNAVIIKARAGSNLKVGDQVEVTAEEFAVLASDGFAVTETQYNAEQAVKASSKASVESAIARAKARGAVAPKDEAVLAKCMAQIEDGVSASFVCDYVDALNGSAEKVMASRLTSFRSELNGSAPLGFGSVSADPIDCAIKACEMQGKQFGLIKAGQHKAAIDTSREFGMILAREIQPLIKASDFSLKELVRAADTTDANVGTIATGLVLMKNLGYLKNIINFMPYISTDFRNEPALFNQPVFTRYIVVPTVTSYAAPTATGSGTTWNQTGGWSDSTANTVDTTVTINKHNGVQISFGTQLLGSTVRNLLSEQVGAQTYALGEQVVKDFLNSLYTSTWTGTVNKYSLGTPFGLTGLVALKNRATLAKLPPIGRFALLHSFYHDGILTDSNLVSAKAITALVNKDLTALESAELPTLYGIKPLESQLSSAVNGTLTSPNISSDGTSVDFATAGINQVGFLGNMSSMLMAARVPQDYTQAFKDIPATAAIEVVTDPDSGLSMLNCRYVNHQLAQVTNRLSLMYGFGQGDPRQGIILAP
tara:strand:+ start:8289 stop:9896 length:1608 start_codon:yes stop_codon:yes gene_type:complete